MGGWGGKSQEGGRGEGGGDGGRLCLKLWWGETEEDSA